MGELLLELDTRDIIEHNSPVNIKIINNTNDNLRYKILIGKDGIWETLREFEKEDELNNALKKLSKINKELDLDKKENIPDTSVQKNDTGVDRKSKVNRMR